MEIITRPTISELIKASWEITKKNIWVLIGLFVGYGIISGILSMIAGQDITSPLYWIVQVVSLFLGTIFSLGYYKNCLNAVRGIEPSFEPFKQQSGKFLQMLIAQICVMIMVVIGCCLLIIPGLWLAARLQFFAYFIIEENSGPIKAIQQSWELTKGEDSFLLMWLLAAIVIVIVGFICLIVGVFVAAVVVYVASAYLFDYYSKTKLAKPADMI